MNDSPNSPDFDWVTARENCSLEREFSLLKRFVKQNYDTKKGFLRKHHAVQFSFTEDNDREFFVSREPKGMQWEIYTLFCFHSETNILSLMVSGKTPS